MFRPSVLFIFLCMLMTGQASAQADPSPGIISSIKNGNSAELGKHFNDMIDLNIPGFKDSYSKIQAERIIRDFFNNNPVSDVSANREGSSPDGSKYTIGSLSAGGKHYRLFFLLRKNKGEYLIYQMNIQPE
ncbi:MAG: DUF4783 domain-containing protein [Bacteroidetes bacterium]|nr:DUF4783 domain-containing protein [Bacteroidota bacterium]